MMRALALKPEVLLLDEPVAGINDVEAAKLGEIFRSSWRPKGQGMAVLLIEHNMRFVTNLCDYVYVLDSGDSDRPGHAPSKWSTIRSSSRPTWGTSTMLEIIRTCMRVTAATRCCTASR
jgi:ABC-type branched-subunit amino acid transport system ATPase component